MVGHTGRPILTALRAFSAIVIATRISFGEAPPQFETVELSPSKIAPVTTIAFDEGNETLLAGCENGAIVAWGIRSQRRVVINRHLEKPVVFLAPERAGSNQLVCGSDGRLVRVPLGAEGKPDILEPARFDRIGGSPDGTKVAMLFSGNEAQAAVFDIRQAKLSNVIPISESGTGIATDNEGSLVAVSSARGLRVIRVADRSIATQFTFSPDQADLVRLGKIAFSPTAGILICGMAEVDGFSVRLSVIDVTRDLLTKQRNAVGCDHFAISPCGQWLALATYHSISLYGLPELDDRMEFENVSDAELSCICLTKDARLVATGARDGTVRLWRRSDAK